jgi:hypothetical protein
MIAAARRTAKEIAPKEVEQGAPFDFGVGGGDTVELPFDTVELPFQGGIVLLVSG